ncbi:MAG: cytochrome ubiquinol oxidase subunit I, partial [Deltaproteobacteria bacterium]|nr:cytochrome ubiquinol oxidase subunit I [Deltaproteobacteria bacterium]
AEGVLSFFLESTFMGVLLFGWHRFSKRVLFFSALMVAVGSTLSAFWIIVANSWMQTPAGYEIVEGRAVLTDFFAAVFNPSTMPRYLHAVDACMITGSLFVMGVAARYLVRGEHVDFARRALKVGLFFGFAAALAQLPIGHFHAVRVSQNQPMKLAAYEGLFETQAEAPLLLFGVPDAEEETVHGAIEAPGMLSVLVSGKTDTVVTGLDKFPKEDWPPLALTFYPFHLMFLLGMSFLGLTALGLLLLWRRKLYDSRWYLKLAFFFIPLPIITNELGWTAAEVGRQPYIVYPSHGNPGMLTRDAISASVSAGEIIASLVMFGIIYLLLFVLWIYLLRRQFLKGPEAVAGEGVAS